MHFLTRVKEETFALRVGAFLCGFFLSLLEMSLCVACFKLYCGVNFDGANWQYWYTANLYYSAHSCESLRRRRRWNLKEKREKADCWEGVRASARNQFIKLCKKEEICVCVCMAWHGKSRSENARMIYLAVLHVL